LSNQSEKNITRSNLRYVPHVTVEEDDAEYEVISFSKKVDEILIKKIYEYSLEKSLGLKDLLSEINKLITRNINDLISINEIRGVFAEMSLILRDPKLFSRISDRYSIFDTENDGIDIEVKSFSPVKQTVEISYQQLTNSDKAIFYFVEVAETASGISVFELYDKLDIRFKDRYI